MMMILESNLSGDSMHDNEIEEDSGWDCAKTLMQQLLINKSPQEVTETSSSSAVTWRRSL